MGKIRKRKINKSKNTSAGDELDEEIQIDSKESTLQTILDQLQSVNVEEKYCGLQTLALFIESPENVEQVMNRGLVKVVAPLMMDVAGSVKNAAAGVLRNLSLVRLEACEAMIEHDVMTPLTCYFHEHAEKWTPTSNLKTKDEDVETFIHCINLLMNLCESSAHIMATTKQLITQELSWSLFKPKIVYKVAIKYTNESHIIDILLRYLDISIFARNIVIAVMQCLFVVVEDNPIAIEKLKNTSEKQLHELLLHTEVDPSILLINTLAAGVIINICEGNIATMPNTVILQIASILAKTLSIDHRLACHQLSSNVPLTEGGGKPITPKGKEGLILENQLNTVSYLLDAQQTAIEILANICSCDDSDDTLGSSESSDSEEVEDEEDNCTSGETMLPEDKLPPEVLEALSSLDIFNKIWARTQLPAENVMLIFKEYDGSELLCKKLIHLQTKALLCINNMLSALPIDNFGGVNGVYKIWVDTGKLIFKKDTDYNLVESATAVMRAALDKIKLTSKGNVSECNLFSELALSDIEMMLTGIKDCQFPEIRSNLIRMIGILALLLVNSLNDTSSNVICTITEFILEQARKENEVWVLAEAVDTLVDLYSEDETDILAAKVNLVDKLAILAPILRNKTRQQKKLPKEYKVLVITANSNLPRFIKYKKGRVKNLHC